MRTLLQLVENDLGYPARLEDGDEGGGGSGGGGNDAAEADRRFWLRRFAWGALFAVPTFLLAMVRWDVPRCFAEWPSKLFFFDRHQSRGL